MNPFVLFDELNQSCFGNRLPKINIKVNGKLKKAAAYLRVYEWPKPFAQSVDCFDYCITISKKLSPESWPRVMAHEMIHLEQWLDSGTADHGKTFLLRSQEISKIIGQRVTIAESSWQFNNYFGCDCGECFVITPASKIKPKVCHVCNTPVVLRPSPKMAKHYEVLGLYLTQQEELKYGIRPMEEEIILDQALKLRLG